MRLEVVLGTWSGMWRGRWGGGAWYERSYRDMRGTGRVEGLSDFMKSVDRVLEA